MEWGGQVSFTITSICLSVQLRPNRDRKEVSYWGCCGCGEEDVCKRPLPPLVRAQLRHVDLPCMLISAPPPHLLHI